MKLPRRSLLSRLSWKPPRAGDTARTSRIALVIDDALRRAGLIATSAPAPADARAEPPPPSAFPRLPRPDSPPPASPLPAATPGGFTAHELATPWGRRAYKLFVPQRDATAPRQLLVMLHGCTQNPDDFAAGTRMNALAQEHGMLVLYPMQSHADNPSKCWNWFRPGDQHRDAGEPALIAALTRHVMQTHAVDADRVYVAGLSAGAAMAGILAREFPDLYAAAGMHSGLAPGAAHDVPSAFAAMQGRAAPRDPGAGSRAIVPLIVFHGDADATVNVSNAERIVADHATGDVRRTIRACPGRTSTVTTYDAGATVEYWLIHGAGHAWSGGDPAGTYADPLGPDASREMVRFFLAHPRG